MATPTETVRVHAYLASQGLGSRREIEGWIRKGQIQINDKPAKLGQKLEPGRDKIKVKGKILYFPKVKESTVFALHKPRGVITSVKDPEGRMTVMDLLPKKQRLFPVGRLDVMSEGLILMTNDGDLAHKLTHPRYEIPKVYEVKVRGNLDPKKIQHLKRGVETPVGKLKPAEVLNIRNVTRKGVAKHVVKIRIYEGKNQHIRRMFEALKCHVIRLKRVSHGPIELRGVARGEYRILPPSVVRSLREKVGL